MLPNVYFFKVTQPKYCQVSGFYHIFRSRSLKEILHKILIYKADKNLCRDFPGVAVVKNPPASAGDTEQVSLSATTSERHDS